MIAVVDANVLIKAYIPETLSDRTGKIFQEVEEGNLFLVVPDLIFHEIGNTLWKKNRSAELEDREVSEILKEILSLPLKIESTKPLTELALEIAITEGITVYDSVYLSLAVVYDTRLITADRRLVSRLKGSVFKKNIVWLSEY